MTTRHQVLLTQITYGLALALLAARAYQQSVYSDVRLIDLPVIEQPQQAEGGELSIALPDMAPLQGFVPVLVFRFRNAGGEARQIAVTLNGFPQGRLTVDAGADRRFDLPLSKSTGEALSAGVPWLLQLNGSGSGWSVQAVAARNFHARLGRVGAVIPSGRVTRTEPWRAIAVVLALLATVAAAGTRLHRSWLTSVTALASVSGLAVLGWTGQVSPYHVLVSWPVFWLLVSVALLPCYAPLARTARAILRSVFSRTHAFGRSAHALARTSYAFARSGHGFWRRHPTTLERLSALLGLCALGLAQPIFEVLSPSPEFFVTRNTTVTDVLLVSAAVCIGVPLLLTAIEWSLRQISPRAATLFFLSSVAVLISALLLPWIKRTDSLEVVGSFAVAIGGGVLVALGAWRLPVVRQFLSALAPAAVVLPALFLLDGQVQGALIPVRGVASGPALARTPPIVVVVFDELPLNSLLGADGRLDAGRYPNFAALARDAFWFRRASTVSSNTVWAVPAIASGRYPTTPGSVPTLRYYPNNLFTFLSAGYETSIFSRFLQLCPDSRCHYDVFAPSETISALLEDLGIVWLHVALPERLTPALPSVVGDWAGFEQERRWRQQQDHRGGEFDRFLATLDGRPAHLNFLHSLLPHMPFEYMPSGRRYIADQAGNERGRGLFWHASRAYVDAVHQRHLLQVGYVDHLVGRLLSRLRALDAYDEALIIITADHGAAYQEGTSRRSPRDANIADIMLVPLFVKLPRQTQGETIDRNVETVDILPTIASVVGTPLPFETDGRSLLDPTRPERPLKRMFTVTKTDVHVRKVTDWEPQLQRSLGRKLARFGARDDIGLFSTPGTRELLGAPLSKVEPVTVRARGAGRIVVENLSSFTDVNLVADPLPLEIRGRIRGSAPPLVLAVVVNGVVAATTVSYEQEQRHVFSTMIPETSLRQGVNEVRVFQLDRDQIRVLPNSAN